MSAYMSKYMSKYMSAHMSIQDPSGFAIFNSTTYDGQIVELRVGYFGTTLEQEADGVEYAVESPTYYAPLQKGVARFDFVIFERSRGHVQLEATCAGLLPAMSNSFLIMPGAAVKLEFLVRRTF